MFTEWLEKKITIEYIEKNHCVTDKRLGPDPVIFGHQNAKWLKFRAQMIDGDELWTFSSPQPSWKLLCGRAGIALVRDGEIVGHIITMMN